MNAKIIVAVVFVVFALILLANERHVSEPWDQGMYPCRYLGVAHWCRDRDAFIEFYTRTVTGGDGRLMATLSREDARNSRD